MWQRSFFYVKNSTPEDRIRLPQYTPGVPSDRSTWKYTPEENEPELKLVHSQIVDLKNNGLTSDDILRCFISRRISPLQLRTHKICYMSGRLDPNRISVHTLDKQDIYKRVKAIAHTTMKDSHWRWGLKPHTRTNPPLRVSDTPVPKLKLFCLTRTDVSFVSAYSSSIVKTLRTALIRGQPTRLGPRIEKTFPDPIRTQRISCR